MAEDRQRRGFGCHVLGLDVGVEARDAGDTLGADTLAGVVLHAFEQVRGEFEVQSIENFGTWRCGRAGFIHPGDLRWTANLAYCSDVQVRMR